MSASAPLVGVQPSEAAVQRSKQFLAEWNATRPLHKLPIDNAKVIELFAHMAECYMFPDKIVSSSRSYELQRGLKLVEEIRAVVSDEDCVVYMLAAQAAFRIQLKKPAPASEDAKAHAPLQGSRFGVAMISEPNFWLSEKGIEHVKAQLDDIHAAAMGTLAENKDKVVVNPKHNMAFNTEQQLMYWHFSFELVDKPREEAQKTEA